MYSRHQWYVCLTDSDGLSLGRIPESCLAPPQLSPSAQFGRPIQVGTTHSQLLPMPVQNIANQDIGNQAHVSKSGSSDRGCPVMLKPFLHSFPLIRMPIGSNDWLCHHLLHSQHQETSMSAHTILSCVAAGRSSCRRRLHYPKLVNSKENLLSDGVNTTRHCGLRYGFQIPLTSVRAVPHQL